MTESIRSLIIIGSGPAGLTAAIYGARANLKPLVIEGTNPGGQLMGTSYVENWPGEISILGPKLMMNMRNHAEHFGAQFLAETVTSVDFQKRPFSITLGNGSTLQAHAIIIATGAIANRLGCPNEDTYWGKGVSTCAVCDGSFYRDKKVIVVGGGDTAMEEASFLKKFTKQITIVQIQDKLSASYALQQRVINDPDITIIYGSQVSEIHGDGSRPTGLTITNLKTNARTTLPADGIFIAIGFKPATDYLNGQVALNSYGHIQVTDGTKTSIEGVFAAGDVHDYRYRQAITSAASGCMALLDAERYLKEHNHE